MKKIQKYTLIGITLLLFSISSANATISLGFDSPIQTGNSLDINIVISGLGAGTAPSLSTYDLDIKFDSSHLSFSGAIFGDSVLGNQLDLFDFGANFSDAALSAVDTVNIYEVSFDTIADLNSLQEDTFTLATLTFDVLKSASSQFSFFVNDLGDTDGSILSADLTSATVTTVPVPTAFWLMASGLVILYKKTKVGILL